MLSTQLCSSSPTASALPTDVFDLEKSAASAAIDAATSTLDALSLKIHAKPELNYEEFAAHDSICELLESQGFAVERSYLGVATAFRASTAGPHNADLPTLVVCAEYDALPEIGHACGHNLITEAAVAAFIGAHAALGNQSGHVVLLGTPAEEGGGGKIELMERGALKGVDAAMMVHPAPIDMLYPPCLAIERITFEFHGRNAHAAAAPFEGINALDAVITMFNNVAMARQQFRPTWRVHGVITHGGVKPNIIPDFTAAEFYVRAPDAEQLAELKARVLAAAEGAAVSHRCTLTIGNRPDQDGIIERPYDNVRTNSVMAELYGGNARRYGGKRFLPRHVEETLSSGSTDMGNVSHAVPSIHPMFKIQINKGQGNHHPGFTARAATDEALGQARAAGKAMAHTIVDLLLTPGALAEAKAEFVAGGAAR